ncbi:integrase core domain-containing protein [Kineosporia succinea]|uniref:Transposase InsO family protein n=1 Tax=Kineosporia succinea TaxID=84632 RepID=A0ABT9PDC2_9ACTN|nr:integrase core domain-containing protein [Kineosporia succinea]MDP9830176.1 transposase InsO family protein [Kineosporia succinea]MDP9830183.1 transposase InsO family protein [Kineosporia succinea]MDP9830704.1 transposase InsO family protein [Kineosporia succinea]
MIGMPERTWRRWQARAKTDQPPRGPWPMPVSQAAEPIVAKHAQEHPAWGHRKIWAMTRYDGVSVSQATVLRIMRRRGLLLPATYQRERRQLAAARKAAFVNPPTGPNQVWQLDFSEFETRKGGTWRLAACRDYWSKYEFGWHLSPTANQHDAIASIDLATTEAERLADGLDLLEQVVDRSTGLISPVVIVTDNGGPFRSFRFEHYIKTRPELAHVRTRVRTPGQNGTRERGFGTLKYEWLYRHDIDHGPALAEQAEAYRLEYNTLRPHEAIAWNRPLEVHLGLADPATPNFPDPKSLPTT